MFKLREFASANEALTGFSHIYYFKNRLTSTNLGESPCARPNITASDPSRDSQYKSLKDHALKEVMNSNQDHCFGHLKGAVTGRGFPHFFSTANHIRLVIKNKKNNRDKVPLLSLTAPSTQNMMPSVMMI